MTSVRRVIKELDDEIAKIMQEYNCSYNAAQKIFYKKFKGYNIKWINS